MWRLLINIIVVNIVLLSWSPTTQASTAGLIVITQCEPTQIQLSYHCSFVIKDKKTNKPVDNIKLIIGADMPSMPMAHHIRPVLATKTEEIGVFNARIQLAMYGKWLLTIKVTGSRNDILVDTVTFNKTMPLL